MTPSNLHTCQGSEHGTRYHGWGGAIYTARATPLACPLTDRDALFPPTSQRITRRRWVTAEASWQGIDEAGDWFL